MSDSSCFQLYEFLDECLEKEETRVIDDDQLSEVEMSFEHKVLELELEIQLLKSQNEELQRKNATNQQLAIKWKRKYFMLKNGNDRLLKGLQKYFGAAQLEIFKGKSKVNKWDVPTLKKA